MKRIISLLLVVVLLVFSVITASAEPLDYKSYVEIYFEKLYSTVSTAEDAQQVAYSTYAYFLSNFHETHKFDGRQYVALKFNSTNPTDEPYFNRFGENDEYYEYSDVTNLLFGSGITVFFGKLLRFPEEHNADFYTLEEIVEWEPYIFDVIYEKFGPDYVGKIGDADKDGELTVLDATTIQRHIAGLELMNIELVGDVDGNDETNILDATVLQQRLVGLA